MAKTKKKKAGTPAAPELEQEVYDLRLEVDSLKRALADKERIQLAKVLQVKVIEGTTKPSTPCFSGQ